MVSYYSFKFIIMNKRKLIVFTFKIFFNLRNKIEKTLFLTLKFYIDLYLSSVLEDRIHMNF